MKTVGKGIVITSPEQFESVRQEPAPEAMEAYFPGGNLPDQAVLVALLSAGIFVTVATFTSVPVSTSQAIVGGVTGVGLGVVGFDGAYFKLGVLGKILACWLVSPVLCSALAFAVYLLLAQVAKRSNPLAWSRAISLLVIVAACYVSFSLGANDVGNAIGPLLNKFPGRGTWLALLGGVAMAVGALTFGRRVTNTVGKSITPLDLSGAFAAQVSAAIGVHAFSLLGIPVSTSQAVVGAVIGVGLTKGKKAVSAKKIATIIAGWVISPTLAAVAAFALYRALISLTGA